MDWQKIVKALTHEKTMRWRQVNSIDMIGNRDLERRIVEGLKIARAIVIAGVDEERKKLGDLKLKREHVLDVRRTCQAVLNMLNNSGRGRAIEKLKGLLARL